MLPLEWATKRTLTLHKDLKYHLHDTLLVLQFHLILSNGNQMEKKMSKNNNNNSTVHLKLYTLALFSIYALTPIFFLFSF